MNAGQGKPPDGKLPAIERPQQVMFGYICEHFLMTRGELDAMKDQIDEFARDEGYALGGMYVERAASTPAAFRGLITAVTRHEASVIGVPSLLHLSGLGASPTDIRDYIELRNNTRVLIANVTSDASASTSADATGHVTSRVGGEDAPTPP